MAKLKKVSFHNNFITHGLTDDLLPVHVQRLYDRVHCHVSLQQARAAFQGLNRIHLNMDASNHTEDTLVSTVYSPDIDKAAYASIVVLNKATTEDMDTEGLKILFLSKAHKKGSICGNQRHVPNFIVSWAGLHQV